MILQEALNKPYEFEELDLKGQIPSGRFGTGTGGKITVVARVHPNNVAEISFADIAAKDAFGITGKGDAFRVFATILSFMRKLIATRKDIKAMMFSAKEPSRRKLYDRFLKLAPRMLGMSYGKNEDTYVLAKDRNVIDQLANKNPRTAVLAEAAGKGKPTDEEIEILNSHLDGMKLSAKHYDLVARMGTKLDQRKVQGVVFRGYKLQRSAVRPLLENKPLKLSETGGGFWNAESWTRDLHVAARFAFELHQPWVVMQSKPSSREIIISIDDALLTKLEKAGFGEDILKALEHYVKWEQEEEVLLKTGGRKYTLCRNVVSMGIPGKMIPDYKELIETRLKASPKNYARFSRDTVMKAKDDLFMFACANGKLVYLPGMDSHYKWAKKMARTRKKA